jgi:hypothetical protein
VLLSRDLGDSRGNDEIHNIVGRFGKQVVNANGLKLRDFATYNYMKIINSFYKHKNVRTYTLSAHNFSTVIDYFIANRKLLELFLDVRIYRGSDIGSDQFLTLAELRFP